MYFEAGIKIPAIHTRPVDYPKLQDVYVYSKEWAGGLFIDFNSVDKLEWRLSVGARAVTDNGIVIKTDNGHLVELVNNKWR